MFRLKSRRDEVEKCYSEMAGYFLEFICNPDSVYIYFWYKFFAHLADREFSYLIVVVIQTKLYINKYSQDHQHKRTSFKPVLFCRQVSARIQRDSSIGIIDFQCDPFLQNELNRWNEIQGERSERIMLIAWIMLKWKIEAHCPSYWTELCVLFQCSSKNFNKSKLIWQILNYFISWKCCN